MAIFILQVFLLSRKSGATADGSSRDEKNGYPQGNMINSHQLDASGKIQPVNSNSGYLNPSGTSIV